MRKKSMHSENLDMSPVVTQEEKKECCICYTDSIEEIGELPCKHQFCFSCIRDWSAVTNTCPLCKAEFKKI